MSYIKKDTITSKNNPLAVSLSKLSDKKYRELDGRFMIDGEKLFIEAVNNHADIEYVILSESYMQFKENFVFEKLDAAGYDTNITVCMSDNVFSKITSEKSPQGIITIAKTIDFSEKYITIYNNENFFSQKRAVMLLCDVRDPGNLGTILRCANAFDIDAVYVSKGCADLFSPKTVRGSMGAIFAQPIRTIDDPQDFIADMRANNTKVYAAALDRDACRLDKLDLASESNSVCFVIGNEGVGLSDEIIAACERSVFIPITDRAESLNASVAASVFMWELFKSKKF